MAIPKKVNMVEVSKDELAQSDSNLIAALAYAPIFQPIIPILTLLIKKDDQFIKFHSVQAIALFVVEFILSIIMVIAIWIIGIILTVATFGLGFIILIPIVLLIVLASLGLTLFLMYKAYKGERFKLPIIGNWAESFR